VEPGSKRWRQVSKSQFAWEVDALAALRELLPDEAPVQAWSNFSFTDGGRIFEVDALVITRKGGYLIEIRSWSGRVFGDQGTWTHERRDGSRKGYPNPANLMAEKARVLASMIQARWPDLGRNGPVRPYLQPLVWFSNPSLRIELPAELRAHIAVVDGAPAELARYSGISDALLAIGPEQAGNNRFRRVSEADSDGVVRALERIGIRDSTRTRTAGSYVLDLPAFTERGSAQDFTAKHQHTGRYARVRIYSNVDGMGPDQARMLRDAAERENSAGSTLRRVDGVIDAIDFDQTEFGPAVILDHDRDWRRLDLALAEEAERPRLDDALRIVEELAATLREAHKRRITHRMLTPQSVWLRHRQGAFWAGCNPLLSDLSLAAREDGSVGTATTTATRIGRMPGVGPTAVELIAGDRSVETFVAPEAFTDLHADGVALDVYSLGALAYMLITGRPPAADRAELRAALAPSGLSLAAVIPEVDPALEAVIRRCTTPIVSDRFQSMSDVAAALALARASVNGAQVADEDDPLITGPGDVLAGRFTVVKRLGQGSTAMALWCRDAHLDSDVVLKVSLGGTSDARVLAEGERLGGLDQANIVKLLEVVELGGRPTLVLSFAGERSLAVVLRDEHTVSPEFLQRWGDDLLEAVRYLERVGVSHRDIKPDNLGVVALGPRREQHLVLFDFSLSPASSSATDAGTPPYLEPFLGGDRRFDLAAERYAAAVTLHEMATGETPVWGDGRTDPAYLPPEVEATVLVEAIDEALREPLTAFFQRALRRDPTARFDTAEDMARAWNEVFAGWEIDAPEDDTPDGPAAPAAWKLPERLALADPIASLGVSRKVATALRKCGATTVGDVARLEPATVNRTRGVAVRTRKQVIRIRAAVLERFADELAEASTTALEEEPSGTPAPTDAQSVHEVPDAGPAHRPDLDALSVRLVPPRGQRGRIGKVADTVRTLLGLLPVASTEAPEDWPSTASVAASLDLTKPAVSNSHQKAREHWGSSSDLVGVIPNLVAALVDLGGVAGASELSDALLDVRSTGLDGPDARRLSAAVVRATVEAAGAGVPDVFAIRRLGRRTVVAVNGPAVRDLLGGERETPPGWEILTEARSADDWAAYDPTALLELAVALGTRANALVADSVVVASSDAVPALRRIRTAAGRALSDSRLVRLAAAASDSAVANSASDLVAVSVTAVDALRWSRPILIGSARLTVVEITDRVAVRFPNVVLPGRPALDDALVAAQLPYSWDPALGSYRSIAEQVGGVQVTVAPSRPPTVVSLGGTVVPLGDHRDPDVAAALAVERRLEASSADGGFLALRVPTDRIADARAGLRPWVNRAEGGLVEVDLEATFLRHLRAAAADVGATWSTVEGADDPARSDWSRLSLLAERAVRATVDEVRSHRRVLAWFPGAIVRHGSGLTPGPLDQLHEAATAAGGDIDLLWLVVLGGTTNALPTVDGTPVPIVADDEWLEITGPWLSNRHRSGPRAEGRSA
jgi:serine/threonine protein kinase